ncbi:bucentaur or craniofacial development-domain-containing protein [Pisolithus sp. B1]|nr:bucentaur or craniofacial development-domain-containing protein [Pisolithus sp. B1]
MPNRSRERSALWASFQASVSTPTPPPKEQESPAELVKIEKRYLFAGKHVTEVVEVPVDSEDAQKWPLWRPHESDSAGERAEERRPPSATPDSTSGPTSRVRPGPRKPRTTLPALPTPGSSKAKKITTLDKSAMDWRAHVTAQSSDVQDELTTNKRGGGYLDKVDFLQRVQDRRQDVLEGSKSNKRRKI